MQNVSVSVTSLNLANRIQSAEFVSAAKAPSGADAAEPQESFNTVLTEAENSHEPAAVNGRPEAKVSKAERSDSKPAKVPDKHPPDNPPGTEIENQGGQSEEKPVVDVSTGAGTKPVKAEGGESEATASEVTASNGTVPNGNPSNTVPVIVVNQDTQAVLTQVVSEVLTSEPAIVQSDVLPDAVKSVVLPDAVNPVVMTDTVKAAVMADIVKTAVMADIVKTAVTADTVKTDARLTLTEVRVELPTVDPGLIVRPEAIVSTPDAPIAETVVSVRGRMPIPIETVESLDIPLPHISIRQNRPVVTPEPALPQVTIKPDPVAALPRVTIESNPVATVPGHSRGTEWTELLEFTRLLDPTVERARYFQPERSDNATELKAEPETWRPRPRLAVSQQVDSFEQTSRISQRQQAPTTQSVNSESTNQVLTRLATNPLNVAPPEQVIRNFYRPQFNLNLQAMPAGGAVQAASGPQAARPAVVPPVPVHLTQEMLVADVREAVIRMASDGRSEARLVLHPPELGELVVRLESSRNGIVRIEFQTFSPLVREALEAGLDRLTDALKSEGLTLAQAEVHLNLQLGPEGQSGESEPGNADGSHAKVDQEDALSSGNPDGAHKEVERLPEGATISIYA